MQRLHVPDDDRRTAHQVAKHALRRAILDGSLPGGTRLVQADVAARLGVSTTPVREALRDLATEGLVRLDAHRGAVVHEATPRDLEELYELRRLLEPEAARRAALHRTAQQLAELEALQEQMAAEADPIQWVSLNRLFHHAVVDAAGSTRMADILHRLEDESALYIGLSLRHQQPRLSSGNEQHRRLLDALRQGDGDAAATVILDHLAHTHDIAIRRLPEDQTQQ